MDQEHRPGRSLRLRHQLTLASMLPLAIFGVVVILVSTYGLREISLRLTLQRNTALVQVAAVALAENLDGYLRPLRTTAWLLEGEDNDASRQEQLLRDRAAFLEPFEGGVTLLDESGMAVATTPGHEERKGLNYSFRGYFRTAAETGRPVFSTVLQEQPSGRDAVVIATPLARDGRFTGVLIGVLFLGSDPWPRTLDPLRTPQGGQVYLVDADGQVIYHPDPAQIGAKIEGNGALQSLLERGRSGSLLHDSPLFGGQTVVSYAPLPGIGWGLIMEEPWRAILSPTSVYQWGVVGLLAAGVILSLAALLFSIQRVTRPLTALVEESARVAEGKPFQPLPMQGPSEIRTLIGVFNHMVLRLAEQQAALRQYALQVLRGQEDERRRLARELHDDTVQELVGLAQRVELCRSSLPDLAAVTERLEELERLTRGALAHVRRMSNDLRPHLLEDLGLAAALQALCEDLGRQMPGARVHCEVVGSERRLAPELELTVFRIVQEALTNVRKHACQATRANVTLYFEQWGILTTIEDDGCGFSMADTRELIRQGHLGLAGMFERAHLFNGELSIESAPGEGTTITLALPCEPPGGKGENTDPGVLRIP